MAATAVQPKLLTHDDYVIGWISALSVEFAAATMMLDELHGGLSVAATDSNTYKLGKIAGHNVVMACINEAGGLPAGITAKNLKESFQNVKYILMVGIGGGIPSSEYEIRLGDVVVSDPKGRCSGVVQSDFGKWEEDGFKITGSLNRPAEGLIKIMGMVQTQDMLQESNVHDFIRHPQGKYSSIIESKIWQYQGRENDHVYQEDPELRENQPCTKCKSSAKHDPDPKIHYGIIASGNQVIKNKEQRDKLGSQLGACCVEMEAFGLMNTFPCLVIRGISDYADGRKDDRWQKYASLTAAAYAKELLTHLSPIVIESTPRIGQQLNHRLDGIEGGIREIQQDRNDLQKKCICEWLSPLQPEAKHRDTHKKLIPDTGKSLLEQFHKWRSDQESFLLFALGAPGAGKTQAMSVLIDHLLQPGQESPKIGVAYIYMDLNDRISQTTENIIGAIMKQLLRSLPEIPQSIEAAWRSRQDAISMDARLEMLHDVCKDFDEIFVCIDALDEHINPAELLKHLKPSERTRFRLVCTGREHIQSIIMTTIQETMVQTYRIKALESDIRAFIKHEIDDARGLGDMLIDDKLEKEIVEKILQLSDGVFLIPVLHVKLVLGESANLGERTITGCRDNLNALQSGLNPAIDKMMQRIENKPLATSILAWIWLAVRPLTVDELLHALAVRVGDDTLNKESFYRPKTFLRCCLGMVTIDAATKTVRLFHSSLKDYFSECGSALGKTVQECHNYIARTCLTYIQFRPFCQKISDQTKQQSVIGEAQILPAYPLLEYASCNWGHHFRVSEQNDETLVELARKFMFKDPQERHWSHLKLCQHLLKQYPGSSEESFLLSFSKWHMIAYFGAHSLLLDQEPSAGSLDSKDSKFGRAPIVWAALGGHGNMVQELLKWRADPNSTDYQKKTALSHAAANGHVEVLKILINTGEIDINARDISGGTALHWAALKGRKNAVSTLLDNGANVHIEDAYGGTPLAWSIGVSKPGVTKLLLAHSAEFEYQYGSIADKIEAIFKFAISNDFQVEYLAELRGMAHKKYIDDGLITNSLDALTKCFTRSFSYNYQTNIESLENMTKMMELLGLATNLTFVCLSMDIAEDEKVTPLSQALAINNVAAAKMLLEKATSLDTPDTNGRTPLSYAAGGGLTKMVKLLLEGGADPNRCDAIGRTPFSYAVGDDLNLMKNLMRWQPKKNTSQDRQRMEQLIKLLLEKGANPNTLDKFGRSPLSQAAGNFNTVAVGLLLREKDVDPDLSDNSGRTPLSYAATKGGKKVVELLLSEANVKPDSHDSKGRTPLSYAAGHGAEDVVRLLLEKNVDPDSEDIHCKTPLFYATKIGHEGIIKTLVERGADAGKKDKKGVTPLSTAIIEGHNAIANLMLPKCNLDTGIVDGNGWTLLFHAARTGSVTVAEMLLQGGANPNLAGKNGIVPLLLAALNGHDDIVRLLLEKGAIVDSKDENGTTPLFWSAGFGRGKATKVLLENGANPNINAPGLYDAVPLCIAILMGRSNEAKMLIDHGADYTGRGSRLQVPLLVSAYVGLDSITKLLLDRGVDPNVQVEHGHTPLFAAVQGRHRNGIKILLDARADPYHKAGDGMMVICHAAQRKDICILRFLFQNGVDSVIWAVLTRLFNFETYLNNLDDAEGKTAYPTTHVENFIGGFPLLEPAATDRKGRTALSHAAERGFKRVTSILAKSRSMDIQDEMGRTPIFYAIDSGEESVVNALLEAGSDINHKEDREGLTPLLYSTVTGKDKMVGVLLEKGADATQKNDTGKTALEVAFDKGFKEICQLLLEHSGGSYDRDGFHLCRNCVLDEALCRKDQRAMDCKHTEPKATLGKDIGGFMADEDVGGRKRRIQELEDGHLDDSRPPKIQCSSANTVKQ